MRLICSRMSRASFTATSFLDRFKAHAFAGAELSKLRQVRRDHGGDLRISSGGLAIGEQDDRLTIRRIWMLPNTVPSETMPTAPAC